MSATEAALRTALQSMVDDCPYDGFEGLERPAALLAAARAALALPPTETKTEYQAVFASGFSVGPFPSWRGGKDTRALGFHVESRTAAGEWKPLESGL